MKKNLALTGSNGFLGRSLYKKIHNDYKVHKISLKNQIEIQKFLEKISNNSYDIIINAAAALQPKSKYEIFINENLPNLISKSIIDKKIKFIHISSINVIYKFLNDQYSISKKNAENNIVNNNVTIIRPSLIISKNYNVSNKIFENYIKIHLPFYPFIFPGNTYRPVILYNLIDFIILEIENNIHRTINIYGSETLNLFDIFSKFSSFKNKNAVKINISFFEKILPNKFKNILNRNQISQQLLINNRSELLKNKGVNKIL